MLLIDRRRYMHASNDVIMTAATNPEVLAICYAQGWCASADKMTKDEAAAVTSLGTAFARSGIIHFDEFKYFVSVTNIINGFYNSSSLVSISLPNSLQEIGAYALLNCSALTSVSIPSSVTSIGAGAMQGCTTLTQVTLPSGMLTIANTAFRNCYKLATITCQATTAPSIQSGTFTSVGLQASNKVLRVPSGASGYDSGYWQDLQTTNGFTLQYI